MISFDDVLEFWFVDTPVTVKQIDRLRARWFAADEKFDAAVAKRFAEVLPLAQSGDLDQWCASARGRLALILILDQFSRRMHRGTSMAFAGDEKALKLCRQGIAEGADRALPSVERAFFYLPLQHAEELSGQLASVRLYDGLLADATAEFTPVLEEFAAEARAHRDVIARFGRFPHRNEMLRRELAPDEAQFMRGSRAKFARVERPA
jgi:uncharacterized protein (DUF924 family)